ncbi:MAG: FAD-dependent thymidylate synthase [Pseudomonadota bacterium]|nr:FAD-dependent thymidylate synthase [Pseudomonadota bacterium]
MSTISVTPILRSAHADNTSKILSTFLLRYPRCIHSEFMTHRVFSRNAASSRAIPVEKLIQDVEENLFVPLYWGKNQAGMQANIEIAPENIARAERAWEAAKNNAVASARILTNLGLHKQIANRLLEPFAHITVLVSATEWDNFLKLRNHEDAEPHIRILAQKLQTELQRTDNIQILTTQSWHLPFIHDEELRHMQVKDLIKLSVARCASTSYKTVDGFDMDLNRAKKIYAKLITSKPSHASPTEHVAKAYLDPLRNYGNFIGFRQLRHFLGI